MKHVGAVDDVLKVTESLGTKLGIAGIGATIIEDFAQDKQGTGTVVKATIGTLSVIFPGPGLAYGILDLTVGVATGTTLTDRIAASVEESLKD